MTLPVVASVKDGDAFAVERTFLSDGLHHNHSFRADSRCDREYDACFVLANIRIGDANPCNVDAIDYGNLLSNLNLCRLIVEGQNLWSTQNFDISASRQRANQRRSLFREPAEKDESTKAKLSI